MSPLVVVLITSISSIGALATVLLTFRSERRQRVTDTSDKNSAVAETKERPTKPAQPNSRSRLYLQKSNSHQVRRIRHPRWYYNIRPMLSMTKLPFITIVIAAIVAGAIGYLVSRATVASRVSANPSPGISTSVPPSESYFIIIPQAGLPGTYIVTGQVAQNDRQETHWLVTATQGGARGFKQEFFVRGPVRLDASGSFKFVDLTSGFAVGPGQPWMILLLAADTRANQTINERYLIDRRIGHAIGLSNLPAGSRVLASNSVNVGS